MTQPIALLLALLALPSLQDPPPSRAGIVLFKMPSDRQRKEEAGYTALQPTDPAAKTYEIRIRPAVEAQKTAADSVEAHAHFLAKTAFVQAGSAPSSGKSQAGYDQSVRGFHVTPTGGQPTAVYVWALQSGKKVAILEFVASDPTLLNDLKGMTAFAEACRLAHATVVVPGDPPLTVYDIDETMDCLQWLLDAPFTDAQREVFRKEIVDGWTKKDEETIKAIGQVAEFRVELAKLTPDQQDLVRKQSEPKVLEELKKENDPCSKLLVEIYDAAHKPIAAGDPALTRQQADAALELFFFIAAELEGVRAKPTASARDEWANKLAASWGTLDANVKKLFAMMPTVWAATRAGWNEMTAADRDEIKKQFGQLDFIKEMRTGFAKIRTEAGTAASAAELQSKLSSNYQFTSSMLRTGFNSTMTQMAAMRNMSATRYTTTYSYRPK